MKQSQSRKVLHNINTSMKNNTPLFRLLQKGCQLRNKDLDRTLSWNKENNRFEIDFAFGSSGAVLKYKTLFSALADFEKPKDEIKFSFRAKKNKTEPIV